MQQVVESEPRSQAERPNQNPPVAFLDTDVVLGYLRGELTAVQLFRAESEGRIRFAMNPIVLQEILLIMDAAVKPEFERIIDHLKFIADRFCEGGGARRRGGAGDREDAAGTGFEEAVAHSNDLIILSSVGNCDFLVTRDKLLKDLVVEDKPQVVTPKQLIARLRAA